MSITIFGKEYKLPISKSIKEKQKLTRQDIFADLGTSNNKFNIIKPHHTGKELQFRKDMQHFLKNVVGRDPFKIGKIKRIQPFDKGEVAVTFQCETENNEKYVCKIQEKDNDLKNEVKAGKIRAKYGANTRQAIKDGSATIGGKEKYYAIFPYIEDPLDIKNLSQEEQNNVYQQIGENMVYMHQAKEKITPGKYVFPEKVTIFDKKIHIKDFLIKKKLVTENEYNNIENTFEKILKKQSPEGSLIHGDMNLSNLFILNEGNTIKIIVADTDAKIGDPMEDVGLAILKCSKYEQGNNMIKNQILTAYEKSGGNINQEKLDIYPSISLFKKAIRHYIMSEKSEEKKTKERHKNSAQKMIQHIKNISEKYS